MRFRDLSGQRFGRLLVIRKSKEKKHGRISFDCLCDCGKTSVVASNDILSKNVGSCGCILQEYRVGYKPDRIKNLVGKRFGKLVVVSQERKMYANNKERVVWRCQCDCGKYKVCLAGNLKLGITTTCGDTLCSGVNKGNSLFCGRFVSKIGRHHSSTLTANDIINQYNKQGGLCYFTGHELTFPEDSKTLISGTYNVSIDRIDNSIKEYNIDNINLVTKDVNLIRLDNTIEEFYSWCKNVYIYNIMNYKLYNTDIIPNKRHGNFSGCGNLPANYWSSVKRNAIKRNISMEITIEDAWNLYLNTGGICSISGVPITFGPKKSRTRKLTGYTASLDRIDSNGHYTIDNVQWVHKKINCMRMKTTVEEFIQIMSDVVLYRKLI